MVALREVVGGHLQSSFGPRLTLSTYTTTYSICDDQTVCVQSLSLHASVGLRWTHRAVGVVSRGRRGWMWPRDIYNNCSMTNGVPSPISLHLVFEGREPTASQMKINRKCFMLIPVGPARVSRRFCFVLFIDIQL